MNSQLLILKSVKYLDNKIPFKLLIIGRGRNYENLKRFVIDNKLQKKVIIKNFI